MIKAIKITLAMLFVVLTKPLWSDSKPQRRPKR